MHTVTAKIENSKPVLIEVESFRDADKVSEALLSLGFGNVGIDVKNDYILDCYEIIERCQIMDAAGLL